MDIDALRSFIAFVDTGSFTRAAKQTFRTQSAISMQMKKLEVETGHALFIKEGRNLGLTEQGQHLVSYARRLVSLHDEALGHFSSHLQHPPLTIGCPDDYAESILPSIVALVRETLPHQSIRVVCDCSTQLRLMLDQGKIDVAILTRAPDAEEGYLLKHDSGVWVKGDNSQADDQTGTQIDSSIGFPIDIEKQTPLSLVLYEPDCKFHSTAIDGLEKQGREYRLMCSSSSATAIKSLLRKGLGISAMARSSVSYGLTIIEGSNLPSLPSVDIVLAVAPIPHPLFASHLAAGISQHFFQKNH
ncbi:MAG: LysR family transcriptional regulator [Gammaproteobacteria bacterium]|mgnify:CR=1 FL=1|jgi:DNA-binding transcriptional LysR family regulator|uniref:Transcriptional regulator n=1 Tax=Marinomonas polaris DSM 16579 TaxID=1122206 RepID=A0A1M4WGH5_9GAMM|nr:LysR family transcriptional regulator [Marinomonas polaris]MBU1294971.1 LysR family transcriptional regulator [Gammaproteobacteria bacterium]MBU1465714.1 LysR family transcriptional regulator [Gammaproteobacteria bacterium]MBU2023135.1 LysR family transcriptional regulator [Gammaproteobacteria bacterium]MBU2240451.1 LysR family transcriptional regulator [Gammaproteobacteria bacterium]MBU2321081.1 LysR family transcriptional regulator [Gammaproteobacteria bacterium]|tara:strand:+ start:1296 stop:2198 length:903 start_codon:yes stop_codon:yes gene_type:complete